MATRAAGTTRKTRIKEPRRKPLEDTPTPRETLTELGELTKFSFSMLRELPKSSIYTSEVLRQLAILVRGSTMFIAVMTAAVGISQTNFGYYFLKAAGAADYLGLVPGVAVARTSTIFLFGYAFAAKVGCGLVSEIGAMKINEELDAYESEGISVRQYVVGTRLAATILYVPIIAPIALLANTMGAYVTAVPILHAVSADTFFLYNWGNQGLFDQFFTVALIAVYSISMTLVACFYGLRAGGGPAGVGTVVARSLVVSLVMMHIIIGIACFAVYGTNLGLPIGG